MLASLSHAGEGVGGKEGFVLVCLEAQVQAQANISIIVHNENLPAIHF